MPIKIPVSQPVAELIGRRAIVCWRCERVYGNDAAAAAAAAAATATARAGALLLLLAAVNDSVQISERQNANFPVF